ncbi:MAG TPA: hypothetical protein PLU58_02700 [Saprospiraceae bacterium]|nr:hypothetical protein [Saprospiraceae bacterium]
MISLYIILAVLFFIVIVQDFKSKHISAILLPAILICAGAISIISSGYQKSLETIGYNLLFVIVQFGLMYAYLKFKYSRTSQVIDKFIGLGDLLFLLAITPLLSLPEFIVAYLISLILSIIYFAFFSSIKKENAEIPLAGMISVVMIFSLLIVYPENLQSFIFNKIIDL